MEFCNRRTRGQATRATQRYGSLGALTAGNRRGSRPQIYPCPPHPRGPPAVPSPPRGDKDGHATGSMRAGRCRWSNSLGLWYDHTEAGDCQSRGVFEGGQPGTPLPRERTHTPAHRRTLGVHAPRPSRAQSRRQTHSFASAHIAPESSHNIGIKRQGHPTTTLDTLSSLLSSARSLRASAGPRRPCRPLSESGAPRSVHMNKTRDTSSERFSFSNDIRAVAAAAAKTNIAAGGSLAARFGSVQFTRYGIQFAAVCTHTVTH